MKRDRHRTLFILVWKTILLYNYFSFTQQNMLWQPKPYKRWSNVTMKACMKDSRDPIDQLIMTDSWMAVEEETPVVGFLRNPRFMAGSGSSLDSGFQADNQGEGLSRG